MTHGSLSWRARPIHCLDFDQDIQTKALANVFQRCSKKLHGGTLFGFSLNLVSADLVFGAAAAAVTGMAWETLVLRDGGKRRWEAKRIVHHCPLRADCPERPAFSQVRS